MRLVVGFLYIYIFFLLVIYQPTDCNSAKVQNSYWPAQQDVCIWVYFLLLQPYCVLHTD